MALLLMLSGCSAPATLRTEQDIVGTWNADDGGVLSFDEDGSLVATNLGVDPISNHEITFSGDGTWSLGRDPRSIDVEWTRAQTAGLDALPGGEPAHGSVKLSDDGTRILILNLQTDGEYVLQRQDRAH
jgi:hypothetical protein